MNNYFSKNFEEFYSEIGKSAWSRGADGGRLQKAKVAPSSKYFFMNNEKPDQDISTQEYEISYDLNSYAFRSDEFDSVKTNKNYVYAGCSYTFASGLPLKDSWAHQLNSVLGGESYFNLGVTGGSTHRIIMNVLNYIKKFGAPKGIFILLPDLTRVDVFVGQGRVTVNTEISYGNQMWGSGAVQITSDEVEEIKKVLTYEKLFYDFCFSIMNLEMICDALNVELYWSTWDEKLNSKILSSEPHKFSGYVNVLDENTLISVTKNLFSNLNSYQKNHPYWDKARDKKHPGLKHQTIYARCFFDLYSRKRNAGV